MLAERATPKEGFVSDSEAMGNPGSSAGDIAPDALPGEATLDSTDSSAELQYLDIDDDLGSRYVRLNIEGEEVSVPLNEALRGYNREAVSTKRFQEAAALREQAERALVIEQALQRDPATTVQILARQAGMTVEEFVGLQQQQAREAAAAQEPTFDDPLEQMLHEERQARLRLEQRIAQREADEQVGRAITGLQQQYQASDEDTRAVVQTALRMGMGPEMFPMIYQALAYQRQQVQGQTVQEVQAQNQQAEQQRQAAALQAAQLVASGSGATNVTTESAGTQSMSLREAIEAAFAQNGISI